jgi:hypothetical protein
VTFNYRGGHQELIRGRLSPADVHWACELLGRLSTAQWRDAFRAAGYTPPVAERFMQRLIAKIEEGRRTTPMRAPGG